MSEDERKRSEIATNRLLDLLRAKDTIEGEQNQAEPSENPEEPTTQEEPRETSEAPIRNLLDSVLDESEPPVQPSPEPEVSEKVIIPAELAADSLLQPIMPLRKAVISESQEAEQEPEESPAEPETAEVQADQDEDRLAQLKSSWKKYRSDAIDTPPSSTSAEDTTVEDAPRTAEVPEPKPDLAEGAAAIKLPSEPVAEEQDEPISQAQSTALDVDKIAELGKKLRLPTKKKEDPEKEIPKEEEVKQPEPKPELEPDLKEEIPEPAVSKREEQREETEPEIAKVEPDKEKPKLVLPKITEKTPEPPAPEPDTQEDAQIPPVEEIISEPVKVEPAPIMEQPQKDEPPEEPEPTIEPEEEKKPSKGIMSLGDKLKSKLEKIGAEAKSKKDKGAKKTTEKRDVDPPEKIKEPKEETESPKPKPVAKTVTEPKPVPPSDQDDSEEEIEPEVVDTKLLATPLEVMTKTVPFEKQFSRLNESERKITIYADEDIVYVIQMKVSSAGIEIEKYHEYELPIRIGGVNITDIDALTKHILDKYIDPKDKKGAYCAYAANVIQSKTHSFQTPKLNKKELEDLISWHAKKNLPFNPEHAITNYEVYQPKDAQKQEILMGIGDGPGLNKLNLIFEKHDLRLRLFTTLPILLWKLFVKNYPDYDTGCYIVIHIGELKTMVVVINHHRFLISREISIGTQDLFKAVQQRVVVDGNAIEIDQETSKQIIHDYGFPMRRTGLTKHSRIDLYKISIFLRPVVERMTSELN